MQERRTQRRERVMFSASAAISPQGAPRSCVVRNLSAGGATVHFGFAALLPLDIYLTIPRKRICSLAKVTWTRDNAVGVAFCTDATPGITASSEMEERLRKSEKKARHLQRRVRSLLGEC